MNGFKWLQSKLNKTFLDDVVLFHSCWCYAAAGSRITVRADLAQKVHLVKREALVKQALTHVHYGLLRYVVAIENASVSCLYCPPYQFTVYHTFNIVHRSYTRAK